MDYERFYEEVSIENGWDFSKVRTSTEGIKWDFYEEVTKRARKTDILLDIGTGGGERLLEVAASLLFSVGIDLSKGMVETARTNLHQSKLTNVRFSQMSADTLQFPADFFDVVSCRHATFFANEVARVVKNGGYFLTQQVSENDKINLKQAFGRGQALNEPDGSLKNRYIEELTEVGFTNVQAFDYDAVEYYHRPSDLIFLLKHTPIIPHFGDEPKDFDILEDFIADNQTEKGIQTNSKRFLIVAEK
ncbi:class I SAM-dependent methyltransferase [Gracilibacillus sp. S3-1-1]|uniref:Class I SAM-dependent methyltransferase n=1 Tax=Gracilibacillus pellucidus TaxID=3095368 RepID=A0ACC6M8B0_9BACI|nr:class I SAM-dependent methyltransferase [Gracilibacillus sp. S3-1-1]MDX8047165.1 class I SAM-dependent methyltransferase [Gracilibacillus sp. S3-1-1]